MGFAKQLNPSYGLDYDLDFSRRIRTRKTLICPSCQLVAGISR
jgi:hypothetical protein